MLVGTSLLYTLTVENRGPSDAQNAQLTDILPVSVTLASASAECAETAPDSGVVTCTLASLAAGDSATFTITVDIDPGLPTAYSLVNEAFVTSDTPDPDPDNNAAVEDTEALAIAALEISKTSDPKPVNAGEQLTYTIVITNNGPAEATDTRMIDTLPAGTTFVSATPSNNGVCNTGVLCLLGTLDLGEVVTVTIVVDVDGSLRQGTVLTNAASAFSEQLDPPEPVTTSETTTVAEDVDISVQKQDLPDPAAIGGSLRYQLYVSNTGPSNAFNVVVTDTLDTDTTFVQATLGFGCTENPAGVITCLIPELEAGDSQLIEIDVDMATGLAEGEILTNTVVITSDSIETDPFNNTDVETTTVRSGTDLSVTKTGPTQAKAGDVLTYTIHVNNLGPSDALTVTVTDTLPSAILTTSVGFASSTGTCTQTNDLVVCDLGDMTLGITDTVAITISGQIDPATTLGSVVENVVQAGTETFDFNLDNNESRHDTLTCGISDLTITKSGPMTATAGLDIITYTLVITNAGPSTAQDVFVEDPLPDGLTLVSVQSMNASGPKGTCAGGVACSVGTLAVFPSEVVTITIVASVDEDAPAGIITNTATVEGAVIEPVIDLPNVAQVTTTIQSMATLEISKIDLFDPVEPGGAMFYRIAVTNTGPSAAAKLVVVDNLPVSITFQSASLGCAHDGSTSGGTITCTVTSLSVNSTELFEITAFAPMDVTSGTVLTNAVVADADNAAQVSTDEQTTVREVFGPSADLQVQKSGDITATAGGQVSYEIVITNAGPGIATGVDLKDVLPEGVTLGSVSSITTTQGLCFPSAFGALCQFGTVQVGDVVTVTLVGDVDSSIADGSTITNTAMVFADNPDPSPGDNSDTAVTTVQAEADLYVSKTSTPATGTAGETLTYQIVVGNRGPSAAHNVTLSDSLPSGFTPDSVSSDPTGCITIPCNLGTIAPDGEVVVEIVGTVDADVSGTITNTARVTSTTPVVNTGDDTDSVVTPIRGVGDLSISKSDTPDPVRAGESLVYTLTVRNNGPSAASAVTVTDTLPSGVTLASATPGYGGPNPLVWNLGAMNVGETRILTVEVTVNSNVANNTLLYNAASVGSDLLDSVTSNNSDTEPTQVIAQADLTIVKAGEPEPVQAGALITYTLTVTNYGPSDAVQVQIVDSLPTQVTLVSTAASQGVCGGATCILGDMTAGSTAVITLVARVKSDVAAGTTVFNVALVSSPTSDPGPNPNFDIETNTVTTLASIQVEKRDLVDPVAPDSLLIYYIVATNDGPSDAENVVLTDTLPAQVSYAGNSDNCIESPTGTLSCTLGTLAAGSTQSFLVTVLVDEAVVTGTVLLNQVAITSTTPLTHSVLTDDEETVVHSSFGTPADLAITKDAISATVVAGELITYTLVVTNNGPGTATDVEVVDSLPDGLTWVSATPSQGLCDSGVVCLLGSMVFEGTPTAVATATITIVARVNSDVAAGTTLTNTAFVQASQPDPDPGDNLSDVPVDVSGVADLEVTKSGSLDPLVAGELLAYTIVITNHGPSDAANVVVTDTLPAGVTVDSSDACFSDVGGNRLVCTLSSLAAGESTSLGIVVSVPPTASGSLLNEVVVDSQTPDPTPANNDDDETTTLTSSADLSIEKAASSEIVTAGELVTYTLTVQNAGPSVAQSVRVTDSLPSDVTFDSATPGYAGPNPLVWNVGSLNPGETHVLTVVVRVNSDVAEGTLIRNPATVGSSTPDPVSTNNEDEATTQVFGAADLEVTKEALSDTVNAGDTLVYTITVHNSGPSVATDVDVKDILPPGLTLDQLLTSQGACAGATCQLGDVPVSTTVVITAITTVDPSLADGSVLTNTAAVFSDSPDPDEDNNFPDEVVLIGVAADLLISKRAAEIVVSPGEDVAYTIVVTNAGPSDATGVTVTDTLPSELTYDSDTDACTEVLPGTLVCNLGAIPAGDSRSFTIIATAGSLASGVKRNTVNVQGNEPDPNPGNNEDSEDITVTDEPSIAVDKILESSDPASVAELVTFTIRITNTGNTTLGTVPLTDTYDTAYLTFASADPEPNEVMTDTGMLVWHDLTAAPPNGFGVDFPKGTTVEVQVVLLAIHYTPEGVQAENRAVVDNVKDELGDPLPGVSDADTVRVIVLPNIEVSKRAEVDGPIEVGDEITFTIQITNIGMVDIVTLPLTDTYDPVYLGFAQADPSHDRYVPGTVEWDDLTGPLPNGFNTPLAPDASFSVRVVFTAVAATEAVTNTVFVENGVDANGNPVNGFASAAVAIAEEPTTAILKFFTAKASGDEVTLLWETITEIDNLGFNVWRSSQSGAGYQRVNSALIPSQAAGTSGARYEFVDRAVPDGIWFYKLETISITGQTSGWHGPAYTQVGDVIGWPIYLPLVMR